MQLRIRRPDDWHLHLRQGLMLRMVAMFTVAVFGRAVVMPNIRMEGHDSDPPPPVRSAADAQWYEDHIEQRLDKGSDFELVMTISLTDTTTPDMIREAAAAGIKAAKVYPTGLTTNSEHGVGDFEADTFHENLRTMEEVGMMLLIHGEVHGSFCLDRETDFIPILSDILARRQTLKIVVEHVTSREMVEFVEHGPDRLAATITAHHLFLTLDDVVGGLISPHNFCKPIAKRPQDRAALQRVVLQSNPKFFFGSDSAPHDITKKECDHGCAGCFTAPIALPLLACFFEAHDKLHLLEAFVSQFGADFYGLPYNEGHVTLVREPWTIPEYYESHPRSVVPFMAGRTLSWQVQT